MARTYGPLPYDQITNMVRQTAGVLPEKGLSSAIPNLYPPDVMEFAKSAIAQQATLKDIALAHEAANKAWQPMNTHIQTARNLPMGTLDAAAGHIADLGKTIANQRLAQKKMDYATEAELAKEERANAKERKRNANYFRFLSAHKPEVAQRAEELGIDPSETSPEDLNRLLQATKPPASAANAFKPYDYHPPGAPPGYTVPGYYHTQTGTYGPGMPQQAGGVPQPSMQPPGPGGQQAPMPQQPQMPQTPFEQQPQEQPQQQQKQPVMPVTGPALLEPLGNQQIDRMAPPPPPPDVTQWPGGSFANPNAANSYQKGKKVWEGRNNFSMRVHDSAVALGNLHRLGRLTGESETFLQEKWNQWLRSDLGEKLHAGNPKYHEMIEQVKIFKRNRQAMLNELRQASELGVRAIDTPAELNFYLEIIADNDLSFQGNLALLDSADRALGWGYGLNRLFQGSPEGQAMLEAARGNGKKDFLKWLESHNEFESSGNGYFEKGAKIPVPADVKMSYGVPANSRPPIPPSDNVLGFDLF